MLLSRVCRIFGGLSLAGLLVGLAIGVYAITASNSVPATNLGDGNNAINGFAVSNVHYAIDGTNANSVNNVQFYLTAATGANATNVTVKVGSSTYTSVGGSPPCSVAGDHQTWTCVTTGLGAGGPTNLEITAAQ